MGMQLTETLSLNAYYPYLEKQTNKNIFNLLNKDHSAKILTVML